MVTQLWGQADLCSRLASCVAVGESLSHFKLVSVSVKWR